MREKENAGDETFSVVSNRSLAKRAKSGVNETGSSSLGRLIVSHDHEERILAGILAAQDMHPPVRLPAFRDQAAAPVQAHFNVAGFQPLDFNRALIGQ